MFPTTFRFGFKTKLSQFSVSISNFEIKNLNQMRNISFLSNLKNYTGPTRKEKDTIGEIDVPSLCLWGAQTQR